MRAARRGRTRHPYPQTRRPGRTSRSAAAPTARCGRRHDAPDAAPRCRPRPALRPRRHPPARRGPARVAAAASGQTARDSAGSIRTGRSKNTNPTDPAGERHVYAAPERPGPLVGRGRTARPAVRLRNAQPAVRFGVEARLPRRNRPRRRVPEATAPDGRNREANPRRHPDRVTRFRSRKPDHRTGRHHPG